MPVRPAICTLLLFAFTAPAEPGPAPRELPPDRAPLPPGAVARLRPPPTPDVAPSPDWIPLLQWSRAGRRLMAAWVEDGRPSPDRARPNLIVWDVESMSAVWHRAGPDGLVGARLADDGAGVTAVSSAGRLSVWAVGAVSRGASFDLAPVVLPYEFARFTADDHVLFGRRTFGPSVAAYDLRTGRRVPVAGAGRADERLTAGPHGTRFGWVDRAGGRRDGRTGRPQPPLEPGPDHPGLPTLVGFAAGDALAFGEVDRFPESVWQVWESFTGRRVAAVRADPDRPLVLSPDGRRVVVLEEVRCVVRDVRTGAEVRVLRAPDVTTAAWAPDASRLATAAPDGTVLVWDVPAPKPAAWEAGAADRLWADLAGEDAAAAWAALWHLLDHPDRAADLLRARLRPVRGPADTPTLIARLDHPRYARREEATRDLARLGEGVEDDLRAALARSASAEQRARLERLLGWLGPAAPPSGDLLRGPRCAWLLERLGTADARRQLTELAGGVPGARVTGEAKRALTRLGPQPAAGPVVKM